MAATIQEGVSPEQGFIVRWKPQASSDLLSEITQHPLCGILLLKSKSHRVSMEAGEGSTHRYESQEAC